MNEIDTLLALRGQKEIVCPKKPGAEERYNKALTEKPFLEWTQDERLEQSCWPCSGHTSQINGPFCGYLTYLARQETLKTQYGCAAGS